MLRLQGGEAALHRVRSRLERHLVELHLGWRSSALRSFSSGQVRARAHAARHTVDVLGHEADDVDTWADVARLRLRTD